MVFRPKGVKCSGNEAVSLDSCGIKIVQNVKVLGVMFNEYMLWDETVQMIDKRLTKGLGII